MKERCKINAHSLFDNQDDNKGFKYMLTRASSPLLFNYFQMLYYFSDLHESAYSQCTSQKPSCFWTFGLGPSAPLSPLKWRFVKCVSGLLPDNSLKKGHVLINHNKHDFSSIKLSFGLFLHIFPPTSWVIPNCLGKEMLHPSIHPSMHPLYGWGRATAHQTHIN